MSSQLSRSPRLTIDDIKDQPTISVRELASFLGVSRDVAYGAAERGEIPTLRLGRRLLVPVPKLLALLGHEEAADPVQESAA